MHIHLRNNPAECHPDPTETTDGAFGCFEEEEEEDDE